MDGRQTGYATATLLTDLGQDDEMAGVVRSIFREHAPQTTVVDLSHAIAPGDTRAAALVLARSAAHLAPGVVMVSVGRRLDRPAIAVEVGDGAAALVGPDNGSLAALVAAVGGADAAVRLSQSPVTIGTEGQPTELAAAEQPVNGSAVTTHSAAEPSAAVHPARDVLAPAAAALCAGAPLERLGTPIDPALLLPSLVPVPRLEPDGTLAGEVLDIDRTGVAQLNVDRATLEAVLDGDTKLTFEWGSERRLATLAAPATPSQTTANTLTLADDVHGLLELHAGNDATAAELGIHVGTEVRLKPVQ